MLPLEVQKQESPGGQTGWRIPEIVYSIAKMHTVSFFGVPCLEVPYVVSHTLVFLLNHYHPASFIHSFLHHHISFLSSLIIRLVRAITEYPSA